MSEKKHIDRLFQEKFKDFDVSPREKVWKNIEKELKTKERKPFLVPFWYKIAGAAAILMIALLAGDFLFEGETKIPVVDTKDNMPHEIQIPSENNPLKKIHSKNAIAVENNTENVENHFENDSDEKEIQILSIENKGIIRLSGNGKITQSNISDREPIVNSDKNLPHGSKEIPNSSRAQNPRALTSVNNQKTSVTSNKNELGPTNGISGDAPKKKKPILASTTTNVSKTIPEKENTTNDLAGKKSLLEVAANKAKEETSLEAFDTSKSIAENTKWQVSPFAAPIYYDGFGNENSLDQSLAKNKGSGEVTMSYGINVAYKLSERLKVRSGISQVSMAYNTHDIAFVSVVKPVALSNISYSSKASDIDIVPQAMSINNSNPNEFTGRNPYTEGILHQQMGYLEVPLELEYALIDKKFGVSIIGGASTLFLNDNSLSINSANGVTDIGEASNLRDMSFSTNIGLGLDYSISKQFEINLEPTFKYQLNTFSGNANGFKPYYFGVYTGIGFKF